VCVSASLGLAFAYRLAHEKEPFLPLSVLANPVVRMGTAAASFAVGVSIGLTVFMPLYYENVHRLSPSDSGLALIPIAVMTTPGSVLSGRIMMYFDRYKWMPVIGLSCATAAIASLAVFPAAPLWWVITALCIFGMGIGTLFSVATVSVQNSVSRFEVGTATGVMNFFRALASALVVAIMGAIILASVGDTGRGAGVELLAKASTIDLAHIYQRVFLCGAVFLILALIALLFMEERPLRGRSEGPPAKR